MKLVRYGPAGKEKPGLIDTEGKLRDLSRKIDDVAGDALSPASINALRKLDTSRLPLVKGTPRLGPCVGSVGKFVAIGLNYIDHAKETGSPIPEHPIVFFKTDTCISGPNDPIMLPKDSTQHRLGGRARDRHRTARAPRRGEGSRCATLPATAYATTSPSASSRSRRAAASGARARAATRSVRSAPGSSRPTRSRDAQNLKCGSKVNGQTRQNGNTSTMIFGVAKLVADVSRYMTLGPGDVITTGTPPGVGLGMKPTPQYLKAGDIVELGIEGLGTQMQKVVAFKARR